MEYINEEKYLNHTPLEQYKYKGHIIYIKREDLTANYPAPPFAKLRGLINFIQNKAPNCEYIGALEPSKNSMYGVGVAWVCKILNKKAVIYYPQYKGQDNENRLNVIKAKELGAEIIGIPATKVSVVFYRVRKLLAEKYPNSFLVPNGFKGCNELVDSTAKEVIETIPDKLLTSKVSWVISCGTGSITSGVLKGILAKKGNPKLTLHLAFSRNQEVLRNRMKEFNPDLDILNITMIDEKYDYSKTYNFDNIWQPVPMNCDYEIKAWNWILKNIDKLEKTIVFWNMGSSLEVQDKRRSVVKELAMIQNGKGTPYEVILNPIPHVIHEMDIKLRGWYKNKVEPSNIRPRPCYTEHLLTTPYLGYCQGNCAFCYVNNGVRGWRSTGVMVVNPNYPEQIKQQLSKLHIGFPLYISSFTEPFNFLEPIYHITEGLSNVANEVNLPILYCTRQAIPDWGIEKLKQNPYSYVQWSVNIINEEDRKRISPGGCPLPKLLENMKLLNKEGIYTSWQVNPIIPGITNKEELIKLLDTAKEVGIQHCLFKFIEIVYSSVDKITDNLKKRLGDRENGRIEEFKKLFTQNIGGVRSIEEKYRKEILDFLAIETKKRNITMGLCYEYESNKFQTAGISLGQKYTTARSCHGRGIPIFYRNKLTESFKPLENCYGACLYCAEEYKGIENCPCKNKDLPLAKALTYSDISKIRIVNE
jgi:DNA repair photolyase